MSEEEAKAEIASLGGRPSHDEITPFVEAIMEWHHLRMIREGKDPAVTAAGLASVLRGLGACHSNGPPSLAC